MKWQLKKTVFFQEHLLDMFLKRDLSMKYIVLKAARSSNLYIMSLKDPLNPLMERKYECWVESMCSIYTNNLPVSYNRNFIVSVLSDDNNFQAIIQFYKRFSDYS